MNKWTGGEKGPPLTEDVANWVHHKADQLQVREKCNRFLVPVRRRLPRTQTSEPLPNSREQQGDYRQRLNEAAKIIISQTDANAGLDIRNNETGRFTEQVGYHLAQVLLSRHNQAEETDDIRMRLKRDTASRLNKAYSRHLQWIDYFEMETPAQTTFLRTFSYAARHLIEHACNALDAAQGPHHNPYGDFLSAVEQVCANQESAVEALRESLSSVPPIDALQGRFLRDKRDIDVYRDILSKEQQGPTVVFQQPASPRP